jgi:Bax protein
MKPLTDPTHRVLAAGLAGAGVVLAIAFVALRLSPPLENGILPPLNPVEKPAVALHVSHAVALDGLFEELDYAPLRSGPAGRVPALLLRVLPYGFDQEGDELLRKQRFIRVLLPIVLRVNRTLERQRAMLEKLARRSRRGEALSPREEHWLEVLATLYRTEPDNWQKLRRRIAPIPPSLAIAQAAAESGWGSSRFAREGNALFGQWSFTPGRGLKPARRGKGQTHSVMTFNRLIDSVWSYARNLNTHAAYRELRSLRAAGKLSGDQLAAGLESYSQQGAAYVALIRRIIAENGLGRLDGLKLAKRPPRGF